MVIVYEEPPIWYQINEPNAPVIIRMPLDTAYADAQGIYAFKELITTSTMLYVEASHPGYYDSTAILVLQKYDPTSGAPIDAYQVNFALRKIPVEKLCVVQGTVVEKSDNAGSAGAMPVEGATVTLWQKGVVVPLGIYDPFSFSDVTDAKGTYEIQVPLDSAAMFYRYVTKENYNTFTDSVLLKPGETLKLEDIYLERTNMSLKPFNRALLEQVQLNACPNPFVHSVVLTLQGAPGSDFQVSIYDVTGKLIAKNLPGSASPAGTSFHWSGQTRLGYHAVPGTYFAVARQNGKAIVHKRLLLR
jgi:hypothetical protein